MKQNHIIELDMCEINAGKNKYYESKVEPKEIEKVKKCVFRSPLLHSPYCHCHVTYGVNCIASLSFTNPLMWPHGIVKCA